MGSAIPRASPWAGPSQPFGLKADSLPPHGLSVFICGFQSQSEIEIEDEIEIERRKPPLTLLPLRETLFLVFSVSSVPRW